MKIGGRGINSVEIAGRLLAVLAREVRPMMLRDLARAADLQPGQAHAYLVSLRKTELVEQDGETGRYRLGPFALHLGLARLKGSDPHRIVGEALAGFSEVTGLMAAMTVWGTHGPTIVRVQEAAQQIHANVRPGGAFALTGTATGKVFAAFLPASLVEPLAAAELRGDRASQPAAAGVSLPGFLAEVAEVRRRGFAVTEGRPVPGISAVAAPVFDHSGQIQAAVTAIAPTGAIDLDPEGRHVRALLDFVGGLSDRLGHRPDGVPRRAGVAAELPAAG